MAILNPLTTANKQGIPRIETSGVAVSTTAVTYSLRNTNFGRPWNGLVAIKVSQAVPTGTTGTLPVQINNQPLTGLGGNAITASDITGVGVLLCWWESAENTLQALNIV